MSNIHEQLKTLVGARRKARVTRWNQDDCRVTGCVMAVSDALVLILAPDDFCIGAVVRTTRREVVLDHFDATGAWAAEPAEVPIGEVSLVQIGAPHCEIFRKYVEAPTNARV